MPLVKKVDDPPEEWTPDKPLEDAEAEEEANAKARSHARYEHLKREHLKKLEKANPPAGPKRFKVFGDDE